jgi:hypothetical protein
MFPKKEGGSKPHPNAGARIHPFPLPNGGGEGGIIFY